MRGPDVVDGAVSQRVDGEVEGVCLNHVVHNDVGAQIRARLQRQEVRLVLRGEVVHDRHRSRRHSGGETKPAPAASDFQHEAPAGDATERDERASYVPCEQ